MTAATTMATAVPAAAATVDRYKEFPPGWRFLRIPTSSTASALAGIALYSACRPRALAVQRAAWLAVRLLGPRALPGATVPWAPAPHDVWATLRERWSRELGAFDAVAGYRRSQSERDGAAVLLLRGGKPIAFVKLRREDDPSLEREERAMRLAHAYGPRSFAVPEPLARGAVAGTGYLAAAPLAARLHHPPAAPPLREIAAEASDALRPLPAPPATPASWTPMHGDFTPWNLRRVGRRTFLLDWEQATWAPPHADEVLYVAVQASLRGGRAAAVEPWRPEQGDAVRYWRDRLAAGEWGGGAGDDRLVASVTRRLDLGAGRA